MGTAVPSHLLQPPTRTLPAIPIAHRNLFPNPTKPLCISRAQDTVYIPSKAIIMIRLHIPSQDTRLHIPRVIRHRNQSLKPDSDRICNIRITVRVKVRVKVRVRGLILIVYAPLALAPPEVGYCQSLNFIAGFMISNRSSLSEALMMSLILTLILILMLHIFPSPSPNANPNPNPNPKPQAIWETKSG